MDKTPETHMNHRIVELETKVSHQDLTIDVLNQRIIEQQQQIDELILQYKTIAQQSQSVDAPQSGDASADKPPHY